jgi:hypothetical protein
MTTFLQIIQHLSFLFQTYIRMWKSSLHFWAIHNILISIHVKNKSLYVYCDEPDESNHHQHTTTSFIISYLHPTCNSNPHMLNLQPLHMKSHLSNGQVKLSFIWLPLTWYTFIKCIALLENYAMDGRNHSFTLLWKRMHHLQCWLY